MALNFADETLYDNIWFGVLNVIDRSNREALALEPDKPNHNAFVERFNRFYHTELLNGYLFRSMSEVEQICEEWITKYKGVRPFVLLNNLPPEFCML